MARKRVVYRVVYKEKRKKDPLAVALGKRGGLARARNLTKEEHIALARKAALARWSRARAAKEIPASGHPKDDEKEPVAVLGVGGHRMIDEGAKVSHSDGGPDDAIVGEIVRRILAVSRPDRIILFGSAAAGRMNRDSDVDLLVLEREVADARKVIIRIRQALAGLPFPFDVVVMSRDRFEETRNVIGGIAWPAARYGRVIYEAA